MIHSLHFPGTWMLNALSLDQPPHLWKYHKLANSETFKMKMSIL